MPAASNPRYIFEKADWPLYKQFVICNHPIDSFGGVDEAIEYFRELIDRSAKAALPRTNGSMKKKTGVMVKQRLSSGHRGEEKRL